MKYIVSMVQLIVKDMYCNNIETLRKVLFINWINYIDFNRSLKIIEQFNRTVWK